jgi:heat shock protein HslJ
LTAAAGFKALALALALACAAVAGCATVPADGGSLENSRWRVVALSGQTTPADGDYRLSFENGRIAGRFGCNQLSGSYHVTGQVLVTEQIASTRMGCPEPAATLESRGLAVLQQPLQFTMAPGPRLALRNAIGLIELERLP